MVLGKSLPQVVEQEREQERPATGELPPRPSEPRVVPGERRGAFDGEDAVLVHRVLVVVVELQQVPGVGEPGHEDLEDAHVVELPQRVPEAVGALEESEKRRDRRSVGLRGQRGHGLAHGLPHDRIDRQRVEHRQFHQPDDRARARHDPRDGARHRAHVEGADAIQAVDHVAEHARCDPPQRSRPTQPAEHGVAHLRDPPRVAEILAHEPLHAEQAVLARHGAALGDPQLFRPREVVVGLACREVQVDAHAGEEFRRLAQVFRVAGGQAAEQREVGG